MDVEIGGGIRDLNMVETYLSAGAWRVILGSAAVDDPDFLQKALETYGEKIAVGVDVNGGHVMTHGWLDDGGVSCEAFCAKLESLGAGAVICTDISRYGMLGGTNLELYRKLTKEFPKLSFVASGGVSTDSDIETLKTIGLGGAIVGKALYTGALDLARAISIAKED